MDMRGVHLLFTMGLIAVGCSLTVAALAEVLPPASPNTINHFSHSLDVAGHRVEWRMHTVENQHLYETLSDGILTDQVRISDPTDPEFAPYIWRTSQTLEAGQADLHEFGIMLGRFDVDQAPLPYLLKAPLAEPPLTGSRLRATGSQNGGS